MENCMMTSPQLIADSYERYHFSVYLYIYNKVNNKEEAEDLSQDVFVRLMDYKQMLRPDTVKFFIYTISRNLVGDDIIVKITPVPTTPLHPQVCQLLPARKVPKEPPMK